MTNIQKGQIRVGQQGLKIIEGIVQKDGTIVNVDVDVVDIGIDSREDNWIMGKHRHHHKHHSSKDEKKDKDKKDKYKKDKDKKDKNEKKDITIRSISMIDKFDIQCKENKYHKKDWNHGLSGDWWHGLDKDQARMRLLEIQRAFENQDKRDEDNGDTKGYGNIVVASMVRNEERHGHLKGFIKCLRNLEKFHKGKIIYVFIEGDSYDNTWSVLREWLSEKNDKGEDKRRYILRKIDRGHGVFMKNRDNKRTKYFAYIRNMLIDLVMSIENVEYVLMVDANYGFKGNLVTELMKILDKDNKDTSIVAPMIYSHKDHLGRFLFYDIWANRRNKKEFRSYYPYADGIEGYLKSGEPFDMDSVGGAYLIKRKVLEEGTRYNGDKDCEHVGFCSDARNKGFKVKTNPKVYVRKGSYDE